MMVQYDNLILPVFFTVNIGINGLFLAAALRFIYNLIKNGEGISDNKLSFVGILVMLIWSGFNLCGILFISLYLIFHITTTILLIIITSSTMILLIILIIIFAILLISSKHELPSCISIIPILIIFLLLLFLIYVEFWLLTNWIHINL